MSADWYAKTGAPGDNSQGSSATIRAEFSAIQTALDKLPTLTGNGGKLVVVNAGGTALDVLTSLTVALGGTGAATLTGILHGNGTSAFTALPLTTAGTIVIGDGAGIPTTLAAFTSATGVLKHEYGGVEADISAIADGGMLVGTGTGTMAVRASMLTGGASGFLKHEVGGIEADISAITTDQFLVGQSLGVIAVRTAAQTRTHLGLGSSATVNTGTSGATIPLLNGTNTFGGATTFSNTVATGAITTTGAITATGEITAYFSDDRLKTRLGRIRWALQKVLSLDAFYWEPNEVAQILGYKPIKQVGLSAQQVLEVMPEVISPAPVDPKYMTLHYEKITVLLVAAVKDLLLLTAAGFGLTWLVILALIFR